MSQTSTCPRCGFVTTHQPDGIPVSGLPEGVTAPPLPESAQPHPVGVCCSPFGIGEKLYWDMEGADPDLPPVQVVFKELLSIEGAEFRLTDGKWEQEGSPQAVSASVVVMGKSIFPCHQKLLDGMAGKEVEATVKSLTPVARWPVLEVA